MSKLNKKTVFDLLGKKFVIPSYQRGYRWKDKQVGALLEHILEFAKDKNIKAKFYCLQPIVVKTLDDNSWEVIDGQQRLTTIYIILSHFMKEYLKEDSLKSNYEQDLFEINYQTRNNSAEFLKNIKEHVDNDNNQNIDFHHMKEAYNTVDSWIKKHLAVRQDKEDFLSTLLGRESDDKSVQVIWYEINNDSNKDISYNLFSRLNIGKIGLTNAELVKALFLRQWGSKVDKYFNLRQIKIASEWDQIESKLQDDSFWAFICHSSFKYTNRIEYIFDIMEDNLDHSKDKEDRYTFNQFYDKVYKEENKEVIIDKLWQEIKTTFQIFETWYNDNELYNIIGFIITTESNKIREILTNYHKNNKIDFKNILKKNIKSKYDGYNLSVLKYNKDNKEIRFVLLLFNIITMIKSNNYRMKFPFDLYNKDSWDIEHIHSQTTKDDVKTPREQKMWLEMFENFYSNDTDTERYKQILSVKELINKSSDENEFGNLFEKIKIDLKIDQLSSQSEDTFDMDGIGNLALLDSATNRSYKNAWFPFKRKRILQEDSEGRFIPITTKNIFMKAYSDSLTNPLVWDKQDGENYKNKMETTIDDYLGGNNE